MIGEAESLVQRAVAAGKRIGGERAGDERLEAAGGGGEAAEVVGFERARPLGGLLGDGLPERARQALGQQVRVQRRAVTGRLVDGPQPVPFAGRGGGEPIGEDGGPPPPRPPPPPL